MTIFSANKPPQTFSWYKHINKTMNKAQSSAVRKLISIKLPARLKPGRGNDSKDKVYYRKNVSGLESQRLNNDADTEQAKVLSVCNWC